jgi:hypothetical protein
MAFSRRPPRKASGAMSDSSMTYDEAIAALHPCERCGRWITVPSCDSCWVDAHKCPPTLDQARTSLLRAIEIGKEAEALMVKFR